MSILALPEELLSRVMDFVCCDDADFRRAQKFPYFQPGHRLAHVCPKFRCVALNTPRMWALISCESSSAEIDALLEKSKNVPLLVAFHFRQRGVSFDGMLDNLAFQVRQ